MVDAMRGRPLYELLKHAWEATRVEFARSIYSSTVARAALALPKFTDSLHGPHRDAFQEVAITQPLDVDPRYGPPMQKEYAAWVYRWWHAAEGPLLWTLTLGDAADTHPSRPRANNAPNAWVP